MLGEHHNSTPLYKLTAISKTYVDAEGPVIAVPQLEIPRGRFLALIGYSGSGKTTLLNVLATLETPDVHSGDNSPSLLFYPSPGSDPEDLLTVSDTRRQALRARFGFVFQQGYLLENLSCGQNIKVPFHVNGYETDGSVEKMMGMVGLPQSFAHRQPFDVSGGERQRVSALRALAHNPCVVFADEVTSNLDEDNATVLLEGLHWWQRGDPNRTVLLVTHNIGQAAKYADAVLLMAPGRICGPLPNVGPAGKSKLTPAELSTKLAEFTERPHHGGTPKSWTPPLVVPPPRPSVRPFAALCAFVLSFAVADVFPPVSQRARKGLFQLAFRRRNAQFHCMASMAFALLLAFFFGNLYAALTGRFRSLVEDRRVAKIEVLGRKDGNRLLSQEDVKELAGLYWTRAPDFTGISLPGEIKAKQLQRIKPAVQAAVGYRVREFRVVKDTSVANLGYSTTLALTAVSTRASDPVLQRVELLTGADVQSMSPDKEETIASVVPRLTQQRGLVCTKDALMRLGFSRRPPTALAMYPPYSSSDVAENIALVGVVDWLPKSADMLITDELFQQFYLERGSGDPLPRFESVDLYFGDMISDGIPLYEALQRSDYSVATDKLALLRWVVALIRAIQYFSLAAGAGIFVVVMISLVVSYSEAIRRKEKEIGVLLAYGTGMRRLYALFLTEVVLVWAIAVALASPAQYLISRAVDRFVAEGFKLQGTERIGAHLPAELWVLILAGSLGVAILSVFYTMRRIDTQHIAQTLRAPE